MPGVLYSLIVLLVAASASSSTICELCKCKRRTADCKNLGLQDSDMSEMNILGKLHDLDLSGNNLTTISLHNLGIRILSISNNPIHNVFLNLNSLKTLDLTGIKFHSMNDLNITHKEKISEIKGLHVETAGAQQFLGYGILNNLELRVAQRVIPWNFLNGLVKLRNLNLTLDEAESVSELFLNSTQEALHSLTITAPKLTSILPRMLERLIVIREISLDLPSVQSVEPYLFNGELHDAATRVFLPSTIRPLVQKIMMHLSNSRLYDKITLKNIHTLPDGLFRNLGTLKHVNLKGIREIPNHLFEGLMPLDVLDLSHNNLQQLHKELLKDLKTAKYLNLSYNELTTLDRDSFGSLVSVRTLDLSHNRISNLDSRALQGLKNSLTHLNMSHNDMHQLPMDLFKGFLSVEGLHMNNMSLKILHNRTFQDMSSLKSLHLRDNHLTNITKDTFRGPTSLMYIDLSGNDLGELPMGIFNDLVDLLKLNLNNNNIRSLPPFFLFKSRYLEQITLEGNLITCDCSLANFEYKENVTCSEPLHLYGMKLTETNINEESCATTTQSYTTTEASTTEEETWTEGVFLPEGETTERDTLPEIDTSMNKEGKMLPDSVTMTQSTSLAARTSFAASISAVARDTATTPDKKLITITTSLPTTSTTEYAPNDKRTLDQGEKEDKEQTDAYQMQNDMASPTKHNSKTQESTNNDVPKQQPGHIGPLKEKEESGDILPVYLWIVIALLVIIDVIAAYIVYKRVKKSRENGKPLLSNSQDTFC